jgi:lipid-A-disaccharide synthase
MSSTAPSGAKPALKVMLVAGEASGDQHAAQLWRIMQQQRPDLYALGMGGEAMRQAGIDIRVDASGLGVIGLGEIIRHYGAIRQALQQMKRLLVDEKPDLLICVDYKEFNFRLARAAKALGIRVLFYVSPQVWAWRSGRVKSYGKAIDHMAVIFPFELKFYQDHGIPATFVGHPLAGKVRPERSVAEQRAAWGVSVDTPVVGLLPGSRSNEISRLLPCMLEAAVELAARHPDMRFVLVQASSVSDADLQVYLDGCPLSFIRVREERYAALHACDAVMTSSGTATLELALLQVPMVICYRLASVSYWLARRLVTIPWIGLPNILAGKTVVRELIQHEANGRLLAEETERLVTDKAYAAGQRQALAAVASSLELESARQGSPLAQVALDMLNT